MCDYAANHFEMDGPGTLKLVLQHGLDCSICAEKGDFVAVIKHGLGLKDEL